VTPEPSPTVRKLKGGCIAEAPHNGQSDAALAPVLMVCWSVVWHFYPRGEAHRAVNSSRTGRPRPITRHGSKRMGR
jgi:hypothetical protein